MRSFMSIAVLLTVGVTASFGFQPANSGSYRSYPYMPHPPQPLYNQARSVYDFKPAQWGQPAQWSQPILSFQQPQQWGIPQPVSDFDKTLQELQARIQPRPHSVHVPVTVPEPRPQPSDPWVSSKPQCPPQPCQTFMYEPVCGFGTDGSTKQFSSTCDYHNNVSCYPGKYAKSEKGECSKVAKTQSQPEQLPMECYIMDGCPRDTNSVCGFRADGTSRPFANQCLFDREIKCRPGTYVRSEKGSCPSAQEQADIQKCQQGTMCPMINAPVCGHAADGTTKTFGNQCSYDIHNKCNPKKFVRAEKGECAKNESEKMREQQMREQERRMYEQRQQQNQQPKTERCEQMMCGMNYDPVCAHAADGTTRRFSNQCAYDGHAKCNPKDFVKVVKGDCPKTESEKMREEQQREQERIRREQYEQQRRQQQQQNQQQQNNRQQHPQQHEPNPWANRQPQCPPQPCMTNHYEPVCGIGADGSSKQFSSTCDYQKHSECSPGKYARLEKGECKVKSQEYKDAIERCVLQRCPNVKEPVCGVAYDGTTEEFLNQCAFDRQSNCYSKRFTKTACPGQPQEQPKSSKCGQGGCAMNYDPVCAHAADGTTKQFSNQCAYDLHAECNPKSFVRVVKGGC